MRTVELLTSSEKQPAKQFFRFVMTHFPANPPWLSNSLSDDEEWSPHMNRRMECVFNESIQIQNHQVSAWFSLDGKDVKLFNLMGNYNCCYRECTDAVM